MNYNKVFELVLQSKQFNKYEQKLSEDDYADLLNDVTYVIGRELSCALEEIGDIANSENSGLSADQRLKEMGETCRNGKLWDSCTCC